MRIDWHNIREDFPGLSSLVHGKPLVYFDNAATTQKPRAVMTKMMSYYEQYCSNIHRGAHYLSEKATKEYEEARKIVARFIGAHDPANIVFTRSTTESVNLVAQCLSKFYFVSGDEIILTEMEHHANIVPWYLIAKEKGLILRVVRVRDDGTLDLEHLKSLFNSRTKLFSFVHASNALGIINPIEKLIALAKQHKVPVFIDGAQAIQHLPINVADWDVDFYAFSGHKAYGPTGIGVLYAKSPWLDEFPPYQGGGDMISSVKFDNIVFAKAPQKFEAGTPHIAGALGLAAALKYIEDLGLSHINAREQKLHDYLHAGLSKIKGLRILGSKENKVSLISFVLENVHPHDLSSIFDREGIAIRAGHLCTEPLVRRFGFSAFARASLSFYNTEQEIDHFVKAFGRIFEVFRL